MMSIPSNNPAAAAAATSPLAQRAVDIAKAQHQVADQARGSKSSEKAEKASGIGETEEDAGTSDRDADGRKIWEVTDEQTNSNEEKAKTEKTLSKDPTGNKGNELDLQG